MKKNEDFFEIYEKLFKGDFELGIAYENRGGGSDVDEELKILESDGKEGEENGHRSIERDCGDSE